MYRNIWLQFWSYGSEKQNMAAIAARAQCLEIWFGPLKDLMPLWKSLQLN